VAKLVHREERDLAILQAITGMDNVSGVSVHIEEDYLLRERMENLRESGFEVPEDFQPTTKPAYEVSEYKHRRWMEDLEGARVNRIMEWELYEPEFDEYIPQPARQVVVIV